MEDSCWLSWQCEDSGQITSELWLSWDLPHLLQVAAVADVPWSSLSYPFWQKDPWLPLRLRPSCCLACYCLFSPAVMFTPGARDGAMLFRFPTLELRGP